MRPTQRVLLSVPVVMLTLLVAAARAEWSSNPAQNLVIANRSGEQVQAKMAVTPDGGCYISWFDNSAGGYDVYLQRLDRYGDEQWVHNGILIANRSYSSTVDYDLAADAAGNAIITYNDDRSGGDQIGVNLVTPNGTLVWGPLGLLMTNTSEFVANPHCVVTTDGYYVLGWSQENDSVLQKLDASGNRMWGPNGIRVVAGTGALMLSQLRPSNGGTVIALWVRPIGSWLGDKHLYTQKYASDGRTLWGANPVIVYDGGSVQNGYFPDFVSDGLGGAVYGWYEVSGSRYVRVQHVNASGVELFAHNGVIGSTVSGRIHLTPDVCYDALSGEIYMFWVETNSNQSLYGLYGQKFSAGGVRQWTNNGHEYIALLSPQLWNVRTVPAPSGALVFWFPSSGATLIKGMRVNSAGTPVWAGSMINICSVSSGKDDMEVAQTATGMVILAWTDERADAGNIYAQNVYPDGTLGGVPAICRGDCDCDGHVGFSDIDYFVAGIPDNELAWQTLYADRHGGALPACRFENCDTNADGHVNFADIDPFVALIPSSCP